MKVAVLTAFALLASCNETPTDHTGGHIEAAETGDESAAPSAAPAAATEGTAQAPAPPAGRAQAIFAGGCFWCMEGPFEAIDGVDSVESGYTGGQVDGVTYRQLGTGTTGHYEAVRVVYDPEAVSYVRLLEVFFRNIDPTQADGQFCDRGPQYRSAIFTATEEERATAAAAIQRTAEHLDARVVTEVLDAAPFWLAEDYHQDYYRTHPVRYATYRAGCGRDRRLEELWGESAH